MKFQYFKILAVLGLCLPYSQSEAFIAGAKASGMAQTGIAYGQDAYAAVYNPAGAVDVGDRADITFEWMQDHKYALEVPPSTSTDTTTTFNALTSRNFYNGDFAINKVFCMDLFGGDLNWAIGVAGYNSEFMKTKYKEPVDLFGTTDVGMEYRRYTLSPFLALEINCNHAIGISIDAHGQRFKADGLQNIAKPAAAPTTPPAFGSVFPNNVTNHGFSHSGGVGATLGWRWKIYDCLAFGLTYRTEAKMGRFKKYQGLLARWGSLDVPEKWAMGLSYRFHPRALVAADVEWIDWRSIRSLHRPLFNNQATANPTINPFGAKASKNGFNGPGFGWKDQAIYRLGFEYTPLACLTLRGGYIYERRLFSSRQTLLNALLINIVQSYLTLGGTWRMNACNEISVFYAHGFEHRIQGFNSVDGGGTTEAGTEVGLKENKDIVGISWGYMF